ncbi:MAG: hypothetical protein IPO08_06505 [Xanthomonadales bacterium]|nr:hypothetical protein [Xanthomonadales bacterium]
MDAEIDALLADVVPEMSTSEFDSHEVIKQILQYPTAPMLACLPTLSNRILT